ncbi:MAG: hypothetical protein WBE13_04660 [Candidatus Acidiferrum sp.]
MFRLGGLQSPRCMLLSKFSLAQGGHNQGVRCMPHKHIDRKHDLRLMVLQDLKGFLKMALEILRRY